MADLGWGEEELTGAGRSSGGLPRVSGNGQVDAAAFVEAKREGPVVLLISRSDKTTSAEIEVLEMDKY